jgi:hypothetical protein
LDHESRIAETDGGTEVNGTTVGKPDGGTVGDGNDANDTHPPTIRAARVARVAITVSRLVGLAVAMADVLPAAGSSSPA